MLDDLRDRIGRARWPAVPSDIGWSLGTDIDYLRDLAQYWATDFDWGAREGELSQIPRFKVDIGKLSIHFAHVKAKSSVSAMPIVLSHGWPDSFWRYSKVISQLTDPAVHGGEPSDAFDVVVPDLPGFGYSDQPLRTAMTSLDIADVWVDLMQTLGYAKFGAAGGDKGSLVSKFLALNHPERTVAVHRMDAGLPVFGGDVSELTTEERDWMQLAAEWGAAEGAYGAVQRTKPQTASVGLNDSPVGLAAWIVEKMRAWSDCDGDIERQFTKDDILTNVTIYWLTQTIGSSMRMYAADSRIPLDQHTRRIEVPSGFTIFGGDILPPPKAWLDRVANVTHYRTPTRGGHFAPFEEPDLYVQELRDFFRPHRQAIPS